MQLARMPNIPYRHATFPIPAHSEWSGERARCHSWAGGRGCVAPEASLSTGVDAFIAAAATPPGPARRAPSSLVLGGRRGGNLAAEGGHGSPPRVELRGRMIVLSAHLRYILFSYSPHTLQQGVQEVCRHLPAHPPAHLPHTSRTPSCTPPAYPPAHLLHTLPHTLSTPPAGFDSL